MCKIPFLPINQMKFLFCHILESWKGYILDITDRIKEKYGLEFHKIARRADEKKNEEMFQMRGNNGPEVLTGLLPAPKRSP